MDQAHGKGEVLSVLGGAEYASVATASGGSVRCRMMHFWSDDDFNIYLSTMKGDPKTLQLTHNPSIALLILKRDGDVNDSREVEVTGRATVIKNDQDREKAFRSIGEKSPVVKYLVESGNTSILDCIKVTPEVVKYRVFKEIVQGKPPTVFSFLHAKTGPSELSLMKLKLKSWKTAVRAPFLTASLVPVMLGAMIAWSMGYALSPELLILTLVAGMVLHAGTNLANDYFDDKSGTDPANKEFVRPFSGGSRVLQLGLLSPLEVLAGALFFLGVGVGLGLYIAWMRGLVVLALGAIGLVSAFFYSAPPLKFSYRGWGEVLVGLNFGVLMVLGSFYVQAQTLRIEPLVASLPIALMIAAVLYINQFQDFNADQIALRRNLVVALGRDKAVMGFVIMTAAAYTSILVGVVTGLLPLLTILALLTLPLAVRGVRYARLHHSDSFELIPANASTILNHLALGLLLIVGYMTAGLGLQGAVYTALIGAVFAAILLALYRHIEEQRRIFLGVKQVVR